MEPLDAAAVAALGDMAHQVGGHAGPKAGKSLVYYMLCRSRR